MGNGISLTKACEFVNKLETAGFNYELFEKVVVSDNLAEKMKNFVQTGGFEESWQQRRARKIMGNNFFGVGEAIKYLDIVPSSLQQITHMAKIPWSEKILQKHKKTHVLVAVFPLSYEDMIIREYFKYYFRWDENWSRDENWYSRKRYEIFCQNKGQANWHLVRKTPILGTESKKWEDQLRMLSGHEVVPSFRVVMYVIFIHRLATREWLFEDNLIRVRNTVRPERPISIEGKHLDPCPGQKTKFRLSNFSDAEGEIVSEVRKKMP